MTTTTPRPTLDQAWQELVQQLRQREIDPRVVGAKMVLVDSLAAAAQRCAVAAHSTSPRMNLLAQLRAIAEALAYGAREHHTYQRLLDDIDENQPPLDEAFDLSMSWPITVSVAYSPRDESQWVGVTDQWARYAAFLHLVNTCTGAGSDSDDEGRFEWLVTETEEQDADGTSPMAWAHELKILRVQVESAADLRVLFGGPDVQLLLALVDYTEATSKHYPLPPWGAWSFGSGQRDDGWQWGRLHVYRCNAQPSRPEEATVEHHAEATVTFGLSQDHEPSECKACELITLGVPPGPVFDPDEDVCGRCGCTDSRACEGGCTWVFEGEEGPVCSACLTDDDREWLKTAFQQRRPELDEDPDAGEPEVDAFGDVVTEADRKHLATCGGGARCRDCGGPCSSAEDLCEDCGEHDGGAL